MARSKSTEASVDVQDRRKLVLSRIKALGISQTSVKMGNDFIPAEFLPTGVVQVDCILGEIPGVARGSLVEVCGEHQSGKSYLCLKAIAEAHKQGLRCALLNIEQSFYEPRALALGVKVRDENLFEMYDEIPTAEMYGNLLEALVTSQEYAVIVVDSITALIPEVDYNKNFSDNPKFGAHAAFVGRLTRKMLGLCGKTKTTVYFINQFRTGASDIPNKYAKIASGGKALEYFCHYRLWTNRIGGTEGKVIGDGGSIIGGKSKMFVQKTRYGVPYQYAVFPIYFKDSKVDPLGEFLFRASARGKEYITVSRKVYQYVDKNTGELYCKDKDAIEFTKKLVAAPAPSILTKEDISTNGFDYIANRLKLNDEQKQEIIDSLDQDRNIDTPLDTSVIGFDDELVEDFTDESFEDDEE